MYASRSTEHIHSLHELESSWSSLMHEIDPSGIEHTDLGQNVEEVRLQSCIVL